MRIAIIGGSLGGLSAAVWLRDIGHDVRIFERSPSPLEERGAGIGLLPETSRYFEERTGIDLDSISIRTEYIRHLDRAGDVVHEMPHPYRFSSWNTIYRHLLQQFEGDRYLLDHEVESIEQQGDGATLQFADGTRHHCDLVVCADGVGSRFRSKFLPGVGPRYSGYIAWRGMVPEGDLPASVTDRLGDALTYVVIANSHILLYPIPGLEGSVEPGSRLINFVWYRNYLEGSDFDDVLTGTDGVRRDVSLPPGLVRPEHVNEVKAHAIARLPEVVSTVVTSTVAPFLQVVLDVEVDRMVFGRVVLLGDAAFVARPHAAAGTAKAADDAWALADALQAHPDVDAGLASWENRQLGVGRQLHERVRSIGRESQFDGTWKAGDSNHLFRLHDTDGH